MTTFDDNDHILQRAREIAMNTAGWLKFLGIVNIVAGGLTAITIVGIVIAWLPIWIGILLFQAGSRAAELGVTGDPEKLIQMLQKLKTYFIIQGILLLIGVAFWIIVIYAGIHNMLPFTY